MNTKITSVLDVFKQAASTLNNPEVQEWKRQGGKVVGYFYSYIPEEIATAAGLLPFKIRGTGSPGAQLADKYFSQNVCSFVRDTFELALKGELGFLDGVVTTNSCDHLRRIYDNWLTIENNPCFHFVHLPKKRGKEQTDLYYRELLQFKKSIEENFGVQITDDKLGDAIKLINEKRRLQREIYELKKKGNPPLTGAETLAIMVAGTAMPVTRYNQLLQELIAELGMSEDRKAPIARLMLVGGELDNPELIEILESQGGLVVTDALWYGTKAIWNNVAETGDPLSALASYYLEDRPVCPRLFGTFSERFKYVKKMAEDYKADGIISVRLLLCDQWGFEQDDLAGFLKEEKIPYLRLETEYALGTTGQLKTRVQAFLETLREV